MLLFGRLRYKYSRKWVLIHQQALLLKCIYRFCQKLISLSLHLIAVWTHYASAVCWARHDQGEFFQSIQIRMNLKFVSKRMSLSISCIKITSNFCWWNHLNICLCFEVLFKPHTISDMIFRLILAVHKKKYTLGVVQFANRRRWSDRVKLWRD